MNHRLLANVNYQIRHTDKEAGILHVYASLENKKKWNEELIVQEFEEEEDNHLYEVNMAICAKEKAVVMFKGKEMCNYDYQGQAEYFVNGLIIANPHLEPLLEIELLDKEFYFNPPPHKIREQLLGLMGISTQDVNRDTRDAQSDSTYDGYNENAPLDIYTEKAAFFAKRALNKAN